MKKIILIALVLTLIFTAVGCGTSNFEEYSNAMKKTRELQKGEIILEANIDNEFRESVLHQEGKFWYEDYENIKLKQKIRTDLEAKKSMVETSASIGGIGTDINMYILGEKFYIELLSPIISPKKYIEVEPGDINFYNMQAFDEYEKNKDENMIGLSNETFEKIKSKWLEILEDENVFKGKKILITTETGEVKAREYTININREQIIELANFVIDTLMKNSEIEKGIQGGQTTRYTNPTNYYQNFNLVKKQLEDAKDLSFSYQVYIDIDDYIVEEKIGFIFESGQKYKSIVKKTEGNVNIQHLNIGKTPTFDIEEPDEDNTIKLEELDTENFPLFKQ